MVNGQVMLEDFVFLLLCIEVKIFIDSLCYSIFYGNIVVDEVQVSMFEYINVFVVGG